MVVEGEAGTAHGDNIGYREMTPSWDGSDWSWTPDSAFVNGTVLDQWQGATVSQGGNGSDDGSFFVGLRVTGLGGGLYHYEYAVHNFDNARGGASLRVPVCPSSSVVNIGFGDIDDLPLNDWTGARVGDELMFSAPPGNALQWNQMFNFWFDCDAAPVAGDVTIDQALPGPGALSLAITTEIPGGTAGIVDLGLGCGAPSPLLTASGLPTIPNAGFGFQLTSTPTAGILLFHALGAASSPIGPGCVQYLDSSTTLHSFVLTNGAGLASVAVPVPNLLALDGLAISWQAAQLVTGGPVRGQLTLSNGLEITVGCR